MRDFTTTIYRKLLIELIRAGYTFQTFQEYLVKPASRVVILKHDVDTRKKNALVLAHIEHALDLSASYYFRILRKSFDPVVLSLIKNIKHEAGYYYEDLDLAKGDAKRAIALFERHLNELRKHCSIKTICSHENSFSKYNNHDLWKSNRYSDFGITGDTGLDVDFNNVLCLTDSRRKWKVHNASGRFKIKIRSTRDMIKKIPDFPDRMMITVHPKQWNDSFFPWLSQLILQRMNSIFSSIFFGRK